MHIIFFYGMKIQSKARKTEKGIHSHSNHTHAIFIVFQGFSRLLDREIPSDHHHRYRHFNEWDSSFTCTSNWVTHETLQIRLALSLAFQSCTWRSVTFFSISISILISRQLMINGSFSITVIVGHNVLFPCHAFCLSSVWYIA